jgi:hypothetical protein
MASESKMNPCPSRGVRLVLSLPGECAPLSEAYGILRAVLETEKKRLPILVSFDIDGTLEVGDPPGRITMAMVQSIQEMGCIIGSASDKPISAQKLIWEEHGIDVQFTVNKHMLDLVRSRFQADAYHHIGDTNMDEYYAVLHGFKFHDVALVSTESWTWLART